MSLSVYESALLVSAIREPGVSISDVREPPAELVLRHADGHGEPLEVARWSAAPDSVDRELLRRVAGPVLDVGCGPGRLGAELTARGIVALGLDISGAAVELARHRGGFAVLGDIFGVVPRAGEWGSVLLIDGNVGIGGDPARLLARSRDLLAPGGSVHVEVGRPGGATGREQVRLERSGQTGAWFWWSWLPDTEVDAISAQAGLRVIDRWQRDGRWFVELAR